MNCKRSVLEDSGRYVCLTVQNLAGGHEIVQELDGGPQGLHGCYQYFGWRTHMFSQVLGQ